MVRLMRVRQLWKGVEAWKSNRIPQDCQSNMMMRQWKIGSWMNNSWRSVHADMFEVEERQRRMGRNMCTAEARWTRKWKWRQEGRKQMMRWISMRLGRYPALSQAMEQMHVRLFAAFALALNGNAIVELYGRHQSKGKCNNWNDEGREELQQQRQLGKRRQQETHQLEQLYHWKQTHLFHCDVSMRVWLNAWHEHRRCQRQRVARLGLRLEVDEESSEP